MNWTPWLVGMCVLIFCSQSRGDEAPLSQNKNTSPKTAFAVVAPDGTLTLKLMEVEKKKVNKLILRLVDEMHVHPMTNIHYTVKRPVYEQVEVEASSFVVKSMMSLQLRDFYHATETSPASEPITAGDVTANDLPSEIKAAAKKLSFQWAITDAKGHPVTQEKVAEALSREVPVLISREPVNELHLLTVKDNTLVFVVPYITGGPPQAVKPMAVPYPANPEVSKIIPFRQPRNP